jgi:23S rRNA (uracil1939-C5)-methyltransferase
MSNIPVKKNEEYIVDIIDNGFEGEGIAKIDGYTVFVSGAIKGEKCKILIVKVTVSHAFGKLIEIIEKSEYRVCEDCSTYKRCGGCSLRHIKYEETLKIKQSMVQNLVNKMFGNKENINVEQTLGMKNNNYYRNKAQYPFGLDKDGNKTVGIFAKRTHEIIPMENCKIQQPIAEKIAKFVLEFIKDNNISVYNENTRSGLFRHLVVKIGIRSKEIMCIIVINGEKFDEEKKLVKYLVEKINFINNNYKLKTIIKNINMKNTNVILGNKNIVLYGDGYIYDKLGEYTFKISPMSFYQTNPVQTEVLYNKAIELANLKKDDIMLDLYCGIGTIGIYASKFVKQVYGIEIVEQAVEDAKENAKLNHIENIKFMCGDVEQVLEQLIKAENVIPNVIFVDPPRRGLDKTTIKNISNLSPERVIYISCNPATMVRDLKLLKDKYSVAKIQPVDMFPYTTHVECVAVLCLKN